MSTIKEISGYKSRTHAQRSRIDYSLLRIVFMQGSHHPDKRLRSLLDRVLEASFIHDHHLEPTQDSIEGWLIMGDDFVDRGSSSTHSPAPCRSIYLPFISGHMCLFCGSTKGSISRALGCVRSHLGHRPFHCQGRSGDCTACDGGYASILNASLSLFHHQLTLLNDLEPRNSSLKRFFEITSKVKRNKILVIYGMHTKSSHRLVSNLLSNQRHGATSRRDETSLE
jgi:hypothetical protein